VLGRRFVCLVFEARRKAGQSKRRGRLTYTESLNHGPLNFKMSGLTISKYCKRCSGVAACFWTSYRNGWQPEWTNCGLPSLAFLQKFDGFLDDFYGVRKPNITSRKTEGGRDEVAGDSNLNITACFGRS